MAGRDDAGVLYGTYELLERLGVVFRLTGDILPSRVRSLVVPELNLSMSPAFHRRGFLLTAVYNNVTMFSWPDYEQFLDEMARMKCNYLQFWWFEYTPWLKFDYRGEAKYLGDVSTRESGYHTWAVGGFGSRTSADITIGREHFARFPRMAPLEMQDIQTPGAGLCSFDQPFAILAHAARRNIKVWLAVESGAIPRTLRGTGRSSAMLPSITSWVVTCTHSTRQTAKSRSSA